MIVTNSKTLKTLKKHCRGTPKDNREGTFHIWNIINAIPKQIPKDHSNGKM